MRGSNFIMLLCFEFSKKNLLKLERDLCHVTKMFTGVNQKSNGSTTVISITLRRGVGVGGAETFSVV